MRLLVTGARGFVGQGLLPTLAAAGHTGIATSREGPGLAALQDRLPTGWQAAGRQAVLSGERPSAAPEAVIHLEVMQHVPRPTAADIAAFERVNVGGTQAWLDWATATGVGRFCYLSSIKAVKPAAGEQTEAAPRQPDTPYGRSKARGEEAVEAWTEKTGGKAVILRPAPVYGPGNEANLAAFTRQVIAGKPCLVGSATARKAIVSRTNLAAAIAWAICQEPAGCEIYNVTDPATLSLAELAATLADLAAAPPPRRIPAWLAAGIAPLGDLLALLGRDFPLSSPRLKAIREETRFSCEKLLAHGFQHPQSTREGLREMVAWMRNPVTQRPSSQNEQIAM